MGFHEIFDYYSLQGLHQAIDIGDVIINGDVWKKLSPDLQAIVETAAKASLTESMTYFVAENSRALDILVNEQGVKLFTPSADYAPARSEEHTNQHQSLMRNSYDVIRLIKKTTHHTHE